MAKFVLIDSNIAGTGGHYLEYAEQILEVAGQRGFECHLGANKAFDGDGANGVRYTSHSIFLHDIWGRNLSRRRRTPNEFTSQDRRYLRDYYSIAGLLWNASASLSVSRHYSQQTTLPTLLAKRLYQVHVARTRVEALQASALNDLPDEADSEAEGRAQRYQAFRKALAQAARDPVATSSESNMLSGMLRQGRVTDAYGNAIAKLLLKLDIGVGDYIFIPTLSLGEARSVRDLLRRDERARQPHWSLLFRRDVYDGYSVDWQNQDWAAHEARNLFASFLPLTGSTRVSFYTDTDQLTAQYNRLGSVPFRTTAIPVRTAADATPRGGDRLTFAYLGDARAEKGFHLLPDIIDALNKGKAGADFLLETQVYHPDPASDIRMLRSMERIRQMPEDLVIRREGALSSTDYQAIIARSDVVFNLYARHNYISRSSGIFVEALAGFKPVLTMAGTWMSALMGDWSQPFHDSALRTSTLISERTFAEIGEWNFLGKPDFAGPARKALNLKPGLSACSSQAVPRKADHVRLEVCTASPHSDAPLCLIIAWQNEHQVTVVELDRRLNRTTGGVISSVFPVPKEARFLWIGLSVDGQLNSCPIEWVRLGWHATGAPIAEMPGGIAIPAGDDARMVRNSVAALQAIKSSYGAYVDSCSWVFEHWCKDQTARALFNDLMTEPPALKRSVRRFVGREW